MINHVRTVLMNVKASAADEHYVDPSFSPITIPTKLVDLHAVLFPGESSAARRNELMRRYEPYLFLPEFDDYLRRIDERVSYEPSNSLSDDFVVGAKEFHELFSSMAATVVVGRSTIFGSTGTYATEKVALGKVWVRSVHDHEKFAAALFALAFCLEEARNG